MCCMEASCCIMTLFPAVPAADRAAIGLSQDIALGSESESCGQAANGVANAPMRL